jgi:hypothetical protein
VSSPFLKFKITWKQVEIRDNALLLKSLQFHFKTCHNPGYNLMAWPVKSQFTQDHTLIYSVNLKTALPSEARRPAKKLRGLMDVTIEFVCVCMNIH